MLPFGKSPLPITVPREAQVLRLPPARRLADAVLAIATALDNPIGSPPLRQVARGKRTACIVISDFTRPVPNRLLLPPVLARLEAAGIPREGIEILVGTGTHRPQTAEEIAELLGPEIASSYRVRNHDCRAEAEHLFLGRTDRGMPVAVDAGYCRADLKLLTGLVEPHLMAGWSGGRKAVCPGICALETISAFHSAALLDDPRAANGVLEGNPVHQEALHAAGMAGADFTVNVTLDEERHLTGVFAGDLEAAHIAAVEHARAGCRVTVPAPADVVVTTSAGYPLDGTLYQATKGAVAAMPIVRPGGAIVLVAACGEGLGSPDFVRAFDYSPADFMRALHTPGFHLFEQWQAQELCKVALHARLFLVTARNADLAQAAARNWVNIADTPDAALAAACGAAGPRVVLMPAGPYLLPEVLGP